MTEKQYIRRFRKVCEKIKTKKISRIARKNNERSFMRRRKMPLSDIIRSIPARKGLTAAMELRRYFSEEGKENKKISKQGYFQQRRKLNPEVFRELNRDCLNDFYSSKEEVKTWNGYTVFAIDGTKAEIPNSKENRETFGMEGNQYGAGQPRALVSGLYDVYNDFFVDLQIGKITESESEAAKRNIRELKQLQVKKTVLIIMDRGYPSIEFIHFLEKQGINYLIRLSSNDYKKERENTEKEDEQIELEHTYSRLAKIKKNHEEEYEEIKGIKSSATRLIRSRLPSGEEFAVITNLPASISKDAICTEYFKRWGIEESYKTLKDKLIFESVTGKASIYVYQDFLAQMLVYNMVQDIRHSADEQVEEKTAGKDYKYPVRTNENMAIGLFKEKMIKLLVESDDSIRDIMFNKLQTDMESYILPVRHLPSHERKYNVANRYMDNIKPAF